MTAGQSNLEALAEAALQHGSEAAAERELAEWLRTNPDQPRMLQWRALLLRALDRREEAVDLLQQAASLARQDGGIAHSLAQTTLEAGRPATALFEQALRLSPSSPAVRVGLTAARFAEGDGPAALDDLAAALTAHPGWYEGHRQFVQLATLLGQHERSFACLHQTIARFPAAGDPVLIAAELRIAAGDHAAALALLEPALAQMSDDRALLLTKAVALDELGETAAASRWFEQAGPAQDVLHAERRIRHLLRQGNLAAALSEAEAWLASEPATVIWPYVAAIWRALDDQHAAWLEQQAGLIRQIDFDPLTTGFGALADNLRAIHKRSGRFVDQSVRTGTQTDGALFARIDPEIVALRQLVCTAIADHIAQLPPLDEQHPQLALRRDQAPRFAGSWSVRLQAEGYHTSHHHPQGWFSGVLYVAVPDGLEQEQGKLALGSPPAELGLDLTPYQLIEPKVGRLVIFPSTLWHGTNSFSEGERMTISFDVARPFEES